MPGFSEWLRRNYRPLAVGCAVVAFALGSLAGRETAGFGYAALLVAAGIVTAMAVGLPMYAERAAAVRAADAEHSAERAKQQMRLVVGRVLTPLAYLLGEITDARPRTGELERLQGQAVQVVLSAATELVERRDVRACFFCVAPGRFRRLELAGYYGRAEPATVAFVGDTGLGEEAFRMIDNDEDGFYPDLTQDAPWGWAEARHRHRSLIAVPVVTDERQFGLLTLDALEPGALAERDVEVVRLLGELLAAALNR